MEEEMGTRADFYIGKGKNAEWLGSIAWDGYPEGIPKDLLKADSEESFRNKVDDFLKSREDKTFPKNGWPWSWEDSRLTDYAYAFDKGKVFAIGFGREWFNPLEPEPDTEFLEENKKESFPNMKDKQNVSFGKNSGFLFFES